MEIIKVTESERDALWNENIGFREINSSSMDGFIEIIIDQECTERANNILNF